MGAGLGKLEVSLAVATTGDDCKPRGTGEKSYMGLDECLPQIVSALDRLDTEHETFLRATKARFNLFEVLRGVGEETGLHSAWLAYLLNPKEKHDCGSLFLELFLRSVDGSWQLHDDSPPVPFGLERLEGIKEAKVVREHRVDEGQLDIWIDLPGWGGIVIENKIYAGEQPQQLGRYSEFLKKRYDDNGKHSWLLYLTRDGSKSVTAGKYPYYRISYREQILRWLAECLRETYQFVNLNQALQQYKNVVHRVTGGLPLENEYQTKVADLVREHPAVLRHLGQLNTTAEAIRLGAWEEFIKALGTGLGQNERHVQLASPIGRIKAFPHSALKYEPNGFRANGLQLTLEYGELRPTPVPFYLGLTTPDKGAFPAPDVVNCFQKSLKDRLELVEVNWPGWRGVCSIPCPDLSDIGLALILEGGGEQVSVTATRAAKAVLEYVEAAEIVWSQISQRGV